MRRVLCSALIWGCFSATAGSAQTPPLLDDFVALASKDEKVAAAAGERLALVWKDAYAPMVLDLARFFRLEPPSGQPQAADDSRGGGR